MKTAMQELKESLNNTHPNNWNDLLLHDLDKLLEKEKEQIENAYIQGFCHCEYTGILDSKKYFKDTFKN